MNDYNYLNWVQSFNTISLNRKWSLHAEYQWRRVDGLKYWQQSLLRAGANYTLNENISLHGGYAWVKTFPYGEYPAAGAFPEHRLYEQVSFRHPLNKWTFHHRFRIEQRWLGKIKPGTDQVEDWVFVHRFRYQFRTQYAFWTKIEKQLYGVAADEIFIGAGKNLGTNIFDQNRIFLLTGFKFNKKFSLETGYFNQTLQQGRRIDDKTIIQRNNGWLVSSILNL
ncbi:MAG TPA: DUF2490 domain-containing protein [Chitinophagaceae bacterium]|nr:DUF2490 domain-containing protein [Chitinophagaceae bacterium]